MAKREREPISVAFSVNCFVWPLNGHVLGKSCPLRELTVFFLSVLIMFCCCIPPYCFGYICFSSGLFPCLVLVNQANTTTTTGFVTFLNLFVIIFSVSPYIYHILVGVSHLKHLQEKTPQLCTVSLEIFAII